MGELKNRLQEDVNTNLNYHLTENPILIESSIKRGRPQFPHPVVELVRIHDVDLHLKQRSSERSWLNKYGFHIFKTLNKFRYAFKNPPVTYTSEKFHISEIDNFDDRIEIFWDEVKDEYSFLVERNREYLNWRYCDPRGGSYIVKQAETEERVLGYCVLRIRVREKKGRYLMGYVMDLLTLPDRLDIAYALIRDAVQHFDDQGVNIVHYWIVKNHPYEQLFKRYGFIDSRTRPHIFYKPIQVGGELDDFKTASANRLHFQYGDTDLI